jgi:hypothetical protein
MRYLSEICGFYFCFAEVPGQPRQKCFGSNAVHLEEIPTLPRNIASIFRVVSCLAKSYTMKMDAQYSSET